MGFKLRQIVEEERFPEAVTLPVLERVIPHTVVEAVVRECGVQEQRVRKLPAVLMLLFCVAWGLFAQHAATQVLRKMVKGLRYIWPGEDDYECATKSALCQARARLGPQPVVMLFHRVCQPLATPATPGAFLFGLRLMAVDGDVEDVYDSPANAAFFGRSHGSRGDGAFPQTRAVYLCECGTHAICDAGFWPYAPSERHGALRLLRSVTPDMLLMWDCGFHSFDMALQTRQRGAHFLGRAPVSIRPKRVRTLADGSYLAYLYPSDPQCKKAGEHLLVRVIEYTLTDPLRPGYGERHCLITSLLDPDQYPALTVAREYHQRWEIEITIDEIQTHQRLPHLPLRSQHPRGVIQEAYGLLLAHYVVRALIHEAALTQPLDPDQLSFTHALEIVRDALAEFQMTAVEQLPRLWQRLLHDILHERLPERDSRSNPRVVKRKVSKFLLKRPEQQLAAQPTLPFHEVIQILN